MRLIIDIPDWAAERHIAIMAGVELLAYKPYAKDVLFVKTARCNMCGLCCEDLATPAPFPIELAEDGSCKHLGEAIGTERLCNLNAMRPWNCCWGDPVLSEDAVAESRNAKEFCSIRYMVIPVEK